MTKPTLEPGVHQEAPNVHTRWVALVAFAFIVIGIISVIITEALITVEPVTVVTPGPVVNGIHTGPIDAQARGQIKAEQARTRLRRLGWANRPQGIAHIPIEDAKALWLRRAEPRGTRPRPVPSVPPDAEPPSGTPPSPEVTP